ncbi:MAG: acyl carrier protein [Bdellovibrionales bacterium]|nr:acyl carrier protein [Bdellovibrionales bacterium]
MSDEIMNKLKQVITDQLGVEDESKITPEATFIEDLGADSLDVVELVMAMEETFELEIPDEDAEKIKTVGQALSFIQSNK